LFSTVSGWTSRFNSDNNAHTLTVGLIAQIADAGNFLITDQFGDFLD